MDVELGEEPELPSLNKLPSTPAKPKNRKTLNDGVKIRRSITTRA